jgi:thiamine-phosphate pyrophosphorylase
VARRIYDPSLYLVTDRSLAGERDLGRIVREALAGGATMVQHREKRLATREFVAAAERMRGVAREAGAALIINDRLDVALAVDADGVHVGQEDMPAALARELIGPERILGVSVSTAEQAREAERAGADYVGSSAVFPTSTKSDIGVPLGLDGLRELVEGSPLPVVAIGGIHAGNAAGVVECGVAGIAVVSALVAAPDPRRSAHELAALVAGGRNG